MSRQTIRGIIAGAGVIGFLIITYIVVVYGTTGFDNVIRQAFYSVRTDGLNTLAESITYLGNWEAIVIICLLLLAYPSTRIKYGLPVAGVAAVTSLTKTIVKPIVARPRPDVSLHLIDQGGYSFPSGHAITGFAVYGLLVFLIWTNMGKGGKRTGLCILCGFLAIAIGLSRIYVGVHYPTDVLAGWSFAIANIAGALMVIDHVKAKKVTELL